MFELTFSFYIKHEIGFYDWLKKQDISKLNDLGQGIHFISLVKPVYGDVGRLQLRFSLDNMELTTKFHEATMKPGFFNELQSYIDYTRVVETTLAKKLI